MADELNDQAVESETAPETEVELDQTQAEQGEGAEEPQYDEDGNLIEAMPEPVDDDSEEVEHEGQKYRIPKALKPALLMQADYTRKTQEVAEQRRALDVERASVVERLAAANQLSEEVVEAKATVRVIEAQLQHYEAIDYATWVSNIRALRAAGRHDEAADQQLEYTEARETMSGLQRAKAAAMEQAAQKNATLETELSEAEKVERQRHLETNWAALERDIPGWSQQKLIEVMSHASTAHGFTPQELSNITDARVIKAFHRLLEADKESAKSAAAAKTRKTTTQIQQQQAVRPAVVVGGRQAPTKPATTSAASDRLSTEDWMKQEAERLRRKRSG